jgi:hypothetical protein
MIRTTLGILDKVVESTHYIQSLRTVYGDFGIHDKIYVYDNTFLLDKTTKILTVNRGQRKEIEGNYHEGW